MFYSCVLQVGEVGAQTSKEEWQILQRMRQRSFYQNKVLSFITLSLSQSVSQCSCWDATDVTLACEDSFHCLTSCCLFWQPCRWQWKILHDFLSVTTRVSSRDFTFISRPLPNKTKLKFGQDLKDCWSFCFECFDSINTIVSKPWVHYAVCNVFRSMDNKCNI